jgi:hypothetical protein
MSLFSSVLVRVKSLLTVVIVVNLSGVTELVARLYSDLLRE